MLRFNVERQVNLRLLVRAIIVMAVLGAGIHFLHAYQVKRNAGALLTEADRAQAEGQGAEAVRYLRQYLALFPGNNDVRERCGFLMCDLARTSADNLRAYFFLGDLLRRDPDRQAARRRLVRMALAGHRFDDAQEHLKALLAAHPDDGELNELLGECDEAQGHYSDARTDYKHALEQAPELLNAYVRLANLLRTRPDEVRLKADGNNSNLAQRADKVVDQMVSANSKNFRAYLLRAEYRQEWHAPKDAEADIQQAYALAPDEAETILASARMTLARVAAAGWDSPEGKKAAGEARRILERGLKAHDKDVRFYRALADLEIDTGRNFRAAGKSDDDSLKKAVAWLRLGLKTLPPEQRDDRDDLRWALASHLIEGKRFKEAGEEVKALRASRLQGILVDYLAARLNLGQDQWWDAIQILERIGGELRQGWPNLAPSAYLALASCYERLGDLDRQYTAYREVVALEPFSVPGNVGLAISLEAMGRLDEAIAAYRKILPRAKQVYGELTRLVVLETLALPLETRQWESVEKMVKDIKPSSPEETAETDVLQAEILAANNRLAEARQLLLDARTRQPKNVKLWIGLASLAQRAGNAKEARKLMEDARQTTGDSPEWRAAYARWWAQNGGPRANDAFLKLAGGLEHFTPRQQQQCLRELALIVRAAGKTDIARGLFEQIVAREPHDLFSHLALFELALQSDDEAAMKHDLESIRRTEGSEATLWTYAEIRFLMWQAQRGDKDRLLEARTLLAWLASKRPIWFVVPVCEAGLEELADNPEAAANDYVRAIDLGARNPLVIRQAVRLLYQQRRYAQADAIIRKLPEETSLFTDLRRIAAEVSLRSEDNVRALSLARQAIAHDSRDYRDYVWLGQMLWSVHQLKEAESIFRRATALGGSSPDPWIARVQYYALTGRPKQAEAVLTEASHRLPPEPAAVALASGYQSLGRIDEARQAYAKAVAAYPKSAALLRNAADFCLANTDFAQAVVYLQRFLQLPPPSADAIAWGRRMLAVALGGTGDYLAARQAMALLNLSADLQANALDTGGTIDDERARAAVLASRHSRQLQRRAVAILEKMAEQRALKPEDEFLLAQLYDALGKSSKGRDRILHLLTSDRDNPRYVTYYIRSLLDRKEVDQAAEWLSHLENAPATFEVAEIKARVYQAQGSADQATRVLRDWAKKMPDRLVRVAGLLDALGLPKDAETVYRSAVEANASGATLQLALFLAHHGQLTEALNLCDEIRKKGAIKTAAGASVMALYLADAGLGPCQRVADWLEPALRSQPQSSSLPADLATLRNLQGRYEEAESLYRSVAARNPANADVLNNLAWLVVLKDRQPDQAGQLVDRAIELAGPQPEFVDTRAVIQLAAGQPDRAIATLEDAAIQPPRASMAFHLAQACYAEGDLPKARAVLATASRLGLKESVAFLHPLEREAYHQLVAALKER